MKSKVIALLIAFIIAGNIRIDADISTIRDLAKSSAYSRQAILALAEKGIISGDQNGNFFPEKAVTRGEIVVLLAKALDLNTENLPANPTFRDVPKSHWAYKYIEAAYRAGIVSGLESGQFGVNSLCTREQMAILLVKAFDLVDNSERLDVMGDFNIADRGQLSDWAYIDVKIALSSGLMSGIGNGAFAPKGKATKEQVVAVLHRYLKDETSIVEKLNQSYGVNKDFKLMLNRDIISQEYYRVDENKKILVTKQFIEQFIPQANMAAYNDVNYIPLEELAGILGYKYTFSKAKNKAYLENHNAPLFPNLYNAVKKAASENYVGKMKTHTYSNLKDLQTGDIVNTDVYSNSTINKDAAYTFSTVYIEVNRKTEKFVIEEKESVDKIYIKGKYQLWIEFDKKRLAAELDQDMFSDIGIVGPLLSQSFITQYKDLPLKKSNTTNINGVKADTYDLLLDKDGIKNFIPGQQYGQIKELLDNIYKGTERYHITYSVRNQQLVSSIIRFTGIASDNEGNKVDVRIHMENDYINIGEEGIVILPTPSEISNVKGN